MKRGNKPKFGRIRNQRTALERSLVTALIEHGRVTTTHVKAKMLSRSADRLVTLAKKQTLAARRLAARRVGDQAVAQLFAALAPKFQERAGGYTRVIRKGRRRSDGAEMSIVEFVQ